MYHIDTSDFYGPHVTMRVALAWLLKRSPNILLIPGTSSLKHLRENLKASLLQIPSKVLADLDSIGGGVDMDEAGDFRAAPLRSARSFLLESLAQRSSSGVGYALREDLKQSRLSCLISTEKRAGSRETIHRFGGRREFCSWRCFTLVGRDEISNLNHVLQP